MSSNELKTFGYLVRTYRKELGISQEKLAEHVGVDLKTIQNFEERDNHRPRRYNVESLAKIFGLKAQDKKQEYTEFFSAAESNQKIQKRIFQNNKKEVNPYTTSVKNDLRNIKNILVICSIMLSNLALIVICMIVIHHQRKRIIHSETVGYGARQSGLEKGIECPSTTHPTN